MNIIDAINNRRSVKHFDPQHRMKQQEIDQLLQLAKLSPTAFNQQNYRFVLVEDKTLRHSIRAVANNQTQVTDASLLIILCADCKAWKKDPRRYWANAPIEVQDYMETSIEKYYRNREHYQRDEAMRSCGIAAQTIMLTALSMGYDTCPMDGFDFDAVAELINLPHDHVITMFVVVGKALKPARARPSQLPMNDIVIHNHF